MPTEERRAPNFTPWVLIILAVVIGVGILFLAIGIGAGLVIYQIKSRAPAPVHLQPIAPDAAKDRQPMQPDE